MIDLPFVLGQLPQGLKSAIVKPLHKKGMKSDYNNYRPISITSFFSNVFERIYLNTLLLFIGKNNTQSSSQFGFTRGKSTIDV